MRNELNMMIKKDDQGIKERMDDVKNIFYLKLTRSERQIGYDYLSNAIAYFFLLPLIYDS